MQEECLGSMEMRLDFAHKARKASDLVKQCSTISVPLQLHRAKITLAEARGSV